jgi:hypothetical protein
MELQHPVKDGVPVLDVSSLVPKWYRAELTLSSMAGPESALGSDDWGPQRLADSLGTMFWPIDLAAAAPTAIPVPRGSGGSRSVIFPIEVTKAPSGAYSQAANKHGILPMRDVDTLDPDYQELLDAVPTYSGQLKIPLGTSGLAIRGSGHLEASRAPIVFPLPLLVAQHEGLDVPDFDSLVHDTFDDAGQTRVSLTQRAPLSTVFKVVDLNTEYPVGGAGKYGSTPRFEKIVSLNFGPAPNGSPRMQRAGAWHGSGMGAAHFGETKVLSMLSQAALGPLGYSGEFQHYVNLTTPSGDSILLASLATLSLWENNNAASPSQGRTGPIASWRPDTAWKAGPYGSEQTPVEIVWDKDYKYPALGKDMLGGYKMVAWGAFKVQNPAGTTSPGSPTGGAAGSPPRGGGGGGGGNPPKGGKGPGNPPKRGKGERDFVHRDPKKNPPDKNKRVGKPELPSDGNGGPSPNKAKKESEKGKGGGSCERAHYPIIDILEARLAKAKATEAGRTSKTGKASAGRMVKRIEDEIARTKERKHQQELNRHKSSSTVPSGHAPSNGGGTWQADSQTVPDMMDVLIEGIADRADGPVCQAMDDNGLGGIGSAFDDFQGGGAGSPNDAGDGGGGGSAGPGYVGPVAIPKSSHQTVEPSVSTKRELEAPSIYFHAKPAPAEVLKPGVHMGVADGITSNNAIFGQDGEAADAGVSFGGANANDPKNILLELEGFTDEQQNGAPIVAHAVSAGEYNAAEAEAGSADPNRRAPPVYSQRGHANAGDGNRIPSLGAGSIVWMSGALKTYHQFLANVGSLPVTVPDFTNIIAAYGDGLIMPVDGRFGIGMRTSASSRVASGFEMKLGTTGDGSNLTPDAYITPKNEESIEITDGIARLHIGHLVKSLAGRERKILRTTGSLTLSYSHDIIIVTGAHPITLPPVVVDGRRYTIYNAHSAAIIVERNGNNINDAASNYTVEPDESVELHGDTGPATDTWYTTGKFGAGVGGGGGGSDAFAWYMAGV